MTPLRKDLTGTPDQVNARLRRDHRLLASVKDLHAQLLLQLVDLHAQRRLGDKTPGRSVGEMPATIHRYHILQLRKCHKYSL